VRRLTAWIAGVGSGVVAYRFWRRHSQAAAEPSPEPDVTAADARAAKLRAKLEESRTAEPVLEEEPAAEPESPEDRRRRVHDEGRAALDDMKSE
jgi:3'-phosphoadenosine 5'-phosphosulfate (PAPS) 3'-phosphatase